MTIHIPKALLFLFGALGLAVGAYMAYEEGPPLYRYLFKFEAM